MSVASLWGQIKVGAAAGVLAGGYPYARNFYYTGDNSPQFGGIVTGSISAALALMVDGDVLLLGPQLYDEGNLVIPEGLDNITIIGMGNRGSCFIEPSTSGDEGLQVLGDGVTLINVGIAHGGTGTWALSVGSQTVSPARFRAYGCKIEGADGTIGAKVWGAGDTLFEDCEFTWVLTGMQIAPNDNGFTTELWIKNCLFHDCATACIAESAAAQVVNGLWLVNNVFARSEAGVAPTDFILLSDNLNTGYMAGNMFANATNQAAVITIGTGILYGPNGTEAGWSTARPA